MNAWETVAYKVAAAINTATNKKAASDHDCHYLLLTTN